ncbi:MAG: sulfatase-like hydrolase/transferase [Verrucomicrobiota bacterium]
MKSLSLLLILLCASPLLPNTNAAKPHQDESARFPNFILVMADDWGYGQTGYYNHPALKTPHIDAMAANGLRFDRFYAGAPNCSPTRGTVMTGRTNDRVGVQDHGYPLRLQENTLGRALRDAGYATAHFGKWHLNGYSGPGAPLLKEDERTPDAFGFDTWLSVSNFFDMNPILSRNGEFEEFEGDSSEIIVDEAIEFIRANKDSGKPFCTVIWYGTPHSPFMAHEKDMEPFADLDDTSKKHYAELVAMDRSIGTLRQALRDLELEKDTVLWVNSDNGGLPRITPGTVGELNGHKGTVYEGGLRVPAVIEWPGTIKKARVTEFPAGTVDIFPTLAELAGLPDSVLLQPQDGISLAAILTTNKNPKTRKKPLGFRHKGRAAWIDNNYKLVTQNVADGEYELFDLENDTSETTDLAKEKPEVLAKMQKAFEKWNASVDRSVAGKDYPEGKVTDTKTERESWPDTGLYDQWRDEWKDRPEFQRYLNKKPK